MRSTVLALLTGCLLGAVTVARNVAQLPFEADLDDSELSEPSFAVFTHADYPQHALRFKVGGLVWIIIYVSSCQAYCTVS